MIVSHTHKFIFIKSEKTGGTSVEAALSRYCRDADIVTSLEDYPFNRDKNSNWVHQSMNAGEFEQHDDAITLRKKLGPDVWSAYFKFSIARNPWDKVVSDFFWQNRRNPIPTPAKRFYHHLGFPFNELGSARKAFSRFVEEGNWQTNDRFYFIDGELCVDYVIRYERLADNLKEVCKRAGLPELELPQLKSGMRSRNHHYSEYYDKETRALVAERHQNDIRHFGYTFETA